MKTIPLTQGKVAIVDDEDYEELNKYKWHADDSTGLWYAKRNVGIEGKRTTIKMHRQLMGFPEGKEIDHINHDGLDNRRENLRVCTHGQNQRNHLRRKDNTSGLIGVSWHTIAKKWRAYIQKDKTLIHIGYFNDKTEAGHAFDNKAIELFGEFAALNFPGEK
jgi:hypothetical protein